MAKKLQTALELSEAVAIEAEGTKKKVYNLILDFVLPPPIYKDSVTTKVGEVSRTTVLVKSILEHPKGWLVTSVEGKEYVVPFHSTKYYQEE